MGLRAGQPSEPLRQRSYIDLYEEAFSRKERLHTRQETAEHALERETKQRLEEFAQGMKERRRLYRAKDTRTHLEREAELLRRREETKKKQEAVRNAQESEELRECTFRPKVLRNRETQKRSPSPNLNVPRAEAADQGGVVGKLRKLAERQRAAIASLRLVAVDEAKLREDLRVMQAALHEKFQQQETGRVVEMLKRGDASSSTHGELVRRVRGTVAAGNDPAAVQVLVAELVGASNQEIERRTFQAMDPKRLEAEGELYERRLALVKELEAVEIEAVELAALHGGSLQERAREAGIELGAAEQALRGLPPRPGGAGRGASEGPRPQGTPSAAASRGCSPESSRAAQSTRTPRSPASECAPPLREADPAQPVKRRLEFVEHAASVPSLGAPRLERHASTHVIVYR